MNLKKTILAIAAGIAGALLLFVVACSLVYTPVYMMRYPALANVRYPRL